MKEKEKPDETNKSNESGEGLSNIEVIESGTAANFFTECRFSPYRFPVNNEAKGDSTEDIRRLQEDGRIANFGYFEPQDTGQDIEQSIPYGKVYYMVMVDEEQDDGNKVLVVKRSGLPATYIMKLPDDKGWKCFDEEEYLREFLINPLFAESGNSEYLVLPGESQNLNEGRHSIDGSRNDPPVFNIPISKEISIDGITYYRSENPNNLQLLIKYMDGHMGSESFDMLDNSYTYTSTSRNEEGVLIEEKVEAVLFDKKFERVVSYWDDKLQGNIVCTLEDYIEGKTNSEDYLEIDESTIGVNGQNCTYRAFIGTDKLQNIERLYGNISEIGKCLSGHQPDPYNINIFGRESQEELALPEAKYEDAISKMNEHIVPILGDDLTLLDFLSKLENKRKEASLKRHFKTQTTGMIARYDTVALEPEWKDTVSKIRF